MLKQSFGLMASALALSIGVALAADAPASPAREPVYGSQLMTPKERAEHRAKMRAAKTPEEKAKIRAELHQRMQERAKQQGLALPDAPPSAGGGMGMGPGGGRNR
jgi:hypothetical protein